MRPENVAPPPGIHQYPSMSAWHFQDDVQISSSSDGTLRGSSPESDSIEGECVGSLSRSPSTLKAVKKEESEEPVLPDLQTYSGHHERSVWAPPTPASIQSSLGVETPDGFRGIGEDRHLDDEKAWLVNSRFSIKEGTYDRVHIKHNPKPAFIHVSQLMMNDREPVRPLEEANILATYGPAKRRLFLFDYDGTLVKIVQNPKKAKIPKTLLEYLRKLASEPRNEVWVISGRDQDFLKLRLGRIPNIGLVAEHGAYISYPGSSHWRNMAEGADMSWKSIVREGFESFAAKTPGCCLEEKQVALVLHYRKACRTTEDKERLRLLVAACKKSLETRLRNHPVNIIAGKCVIEARPANVNKGRIVDTIIDEFRHREGRLPEFIFCVGDDVTDEGRLVMTFGNDDFTDRIQICFSLSEILIFTMSA